MTTLLSRETVGCGRLDETDRAAGLLLRSILRLNAKKRYGGLDCRNCHYPAKKVNGMQELERLFTRGFNRDQIWLSGVASVH